MYNPNIARWNGVDKKSEKYLHISPYTYVANSPLVLVDPNGEEIIFTINRDDKGEISSVDISITGKVIFQDGSTRSPEEREAWIANLKSSLEASFTPDHGVSISVTASFSEVTDENKLLDSDHSVYVVTQQTLDEMESEAETSSDARIAASAEIGGKRMFATWDVDSRSLRHETGHWLGLHHPDKYQGPYIGTDAQGNQTYTELDLQGQFHRKNIMRTSASLKGQVNNPANATKLENFQLLWIEQYSNTNLLNQGNNLYEKHNGTRVQLYINSAFEVHMNNQK